MEFSCIGCECHIHNYIGDGENERYEWRCAAKKDKVVGLEEIFNLRPTLPNWCPILVNIKKRIKKEILNQF